MSQKIARILPSLACPIFVSSRQGVANNIESLHLPPYPDIDLNNWEAFTFSHLRWLGLRYFYDEWPPDRSLFQMVVYHELWHTELTTTPFSRVIRAEMFNFYLMLLDTIYEGQEGILVPILPKESGNELEKQWARLVILHSASRLVEEIYAVRMSLLEAKELRLISHDLLQTLITIYKEKYGEYMPEFPVVYNAFDCIAKKLGKHFATGLIYCVLATYNPTTALLDIIKEMFEVDPRVAANDFLWNIPDEDVNSLANMSFEEVYYGITNLLFNLDPDDSRYGRRRMEESIQLLKEEGERSVKENWGEFAKFLLGTPKTFIVSSYNEDRHFFHDSDEMQIPYGSPAFVVEAIRQQLTKGIGLVCPFWYDAPHKCCSRSNRELLEKVWSCTSPIPGWKLWMRGGCLDKKAVACARRRAKNPGTKA